MDCIKRTYPDYKRTVLGAIGSAFQGGELTKAKVSEKAQKVFP